MESLDEKNSGLWERGVAFDRRRPHFVRVAAAGDEATLVEGEILEMYWPYGVDAVTGLGGLYVYTARFLHPPSGGPGSEAPPLVCAYSERTPDTRMVLRERTYRVPGFVLTVTSCSPRPDAEVFGPFPDWCSAASHRSARGALCEASCEPPGGGDGPRSRDGVPPLPPTTLEVVLACSGWAGNVALLQFNALFVGVGRLVTRAGLYLDRQVSVPSEGRFQLARLETVFWREVESLQASLPPCMAGRASAARAGLLAARYAVQKVGQKERAAGGWTLGTVRAIQSMERATSTPSCHVLEMESSGVTVRGTWTGSARRRPRRLRLSFHRICRATDWASFRLPAWHSSSAGDARSLSVLYELNTAQDAAGRPLVEFVRQLSDTHTLCTKRLWLPAACAAPAVDATDIVTAAAVCHPERRRVPSAAAAALERLVYSAKIDSRCPTADVLVNRLSQATCADLLGSWGLRVPPLADWMADAKEPSADPWLLRADLHQPLHAAFTMQREAATEREETVVLCSSTARSGRGDVFCWQPSCKHRLLLWRAVVHGPPGGPGDDVLPAAVGGRTPGIVLDLFEAPWLKDAGAGVVPDGASVLALGQYCLGGDAGRPVAGCLMARYRDQLDSVIFALAPAAPTAAWMACDDEPVIVIEAKEPGSTFGSLAKAFAALRETLREATTSKSSSDALLRFVRDQWEGCAGGRAAAELVPSWPPPTTGIVGGLHRDLRAALQRVPRALFDHPLGDDSGAFKDFADDLCVRRAHWSSDAFFVADAPGSRPVRLRPGPGPGRNHGERVGIPVYIGPLLEVLDEYAEDEKKECETQGSDDGDGGAVDVEPDSETRPSTPSSPRCPGVPGKTYETHSWVTPGGRWSQLVEWTGHAGACQDPAGGGSDSKSSSSSSSSRDIAWAPGAQSSDRHSGPLGAGDHHRVDSARPSEARAATLLQRVGRVWNPGLLLHKLTMTVDGHPCMLDYWLPPDEPVRVHPGRGGRGAAAAPTDAECTSLRAFPLRMRPVLLAPRAGRTRDDLYWDPQGSGDWLYPEEYVPEPCPVCRLAPARRLGFPCRHKACADCWRRLALSTGSCWCGRLVLRTDPIDEARYVEAKRSAEEGGVMRAVAGAWRRFWSGSGQETDRKQPALLSPPSSSSSSSSSSAVELVTPRSSSSSEHPLAPAADDGVPSLGVSLPWIYEAAGGFAYHLRTWAHADLAVDPSGGRAVDRRCAPGLHGHQNRDAVKRHYNFHQLPPELLLFELCYELAHVCRLRDSVVLCAVAEFALGDRLPDVPGVLRRLVVGQLADDPPRPARFRFAADAAVALASDDAYRAAAS